MGITIEVVGAEELVNSLNKKSRKIKDNINIGLQESGFILKDEIQESILGNRAESRSVNTGNFLASITSQGINNGVQISSDVEYAKFLEWGTSRMEGRRHFNNSMDRSLPAIKQKMKDVIKDAIE